MNVQTFERILHQKEAWHRTIREARYISNYDSSWTWEQRNLWDQQDNAVNKHLTNFMWLTFLAEKVVIELGFPDQKTLELYWIACFYNDYKSLGLNAITLWSSYWEAPRRVFPYIEWQISYDSNKKVFSLEIPEILTVEDVSKALPSLKAQLTGRRKGEVLPDTHRAKLRPEFLMLKPEVENQIRRAASGEITYADALKEEYRRWLEIERHQINSAPDIYAKLTKLQSLRRRVRERVRQRYKRAGLPCEYSRHDWWTQIEEDLNIK